MALKIFKKRKMNFFGLNSAHFEHSLVKSLSHTNIISIKGYYEDSDYLCIIQELMSSDLRALIVELNDPLEEVQIKEIFCQMLKAIEHCHKENIVHRDIKLENFLVDSDETGKVKIKLSDFGLACKFDKDEPPTTKCGSILSVAPEMLIKDNYCPKVDMWGAGVILYELLSTQLPFYSDNETQYKKNIVKEKLKLDDSTLWKNISDTAKDLVLQLLNKDPLTRPDATEALNHPWFDEIKASYKDVSKQEFVLSAETVNEDEDASLKLD